MSKEKETQKEQPKEEAIDYKELALRSQANFDNFRKQTEKRIQDIHKFAAKKIILDILPVVDNFERALQAKDKGEDFVKGIELIYAQLNTVLDNNNVKPLDTKDKEFNPHEHEALLKVPSERQENTILEELQKGYTLNGTVLRPAKVKLSAGKEKNNQEK